jgi:hypothetical protein
VLASDLGLDRSSFKWWIATGLVLSAFYLTLMLAFTGGKLYFEQDLPGFYNLYDLLLYPTYPAGLLANLIYAGSYVLGGFNFYVGDYIALFVSMFLLLLGGSLFTRILLRGVLSGTALNWASSLSALFWVIGPIAISNAKTSFAPGQILPSEAFALFFLAFTIALIHTPERPVLQDAPLLVSLSVAALLSLTIYPASLRDLMLDVALFVALWLFYGIVSALVRTGWRERVKVGGRKLLLGAIGLTIVALIALGPLLLDFGAYAHTFQAGAVAHANFSFYSGTFNTIPFSLRLLANWEAPYSPYYSSYATLGPIAILSFYWPALLILAWVVILPSRRGISLLPGAIITSILLFWYTAANPPLGNVWTAINSQLPYQYQLLPPDWVTIDLGAFFFAFVALSVVWFAPVFSIWGPAGPGITQTLPHRRRRGNAVRVAVTVCIAGVLVASMLPVFTGAPETMSWNSVPATYTVPNAYSSARSFLMRSCDASGCNALLFPQTGAYVALNWGSDGIYYGVATFYLLYFAPAGLIGQSTFGGTMATPQQQSEYQNITTPTITAPGTSNTTLNPTWLPLIERNSVRYLLVDYSISTSSQELAYLNSSLTYLVSNGIVQMSMNNYPLVIYAITAQ